MSVWWIVGLPSHAESPAAHTTYTAYPLQYQAAGKLEPVLREMLEPWHATTRIVIDSESNQILIHGPVEAQRIAERLIHETDRRPANQADTQNSDPSRPVQDSNELRTYKIKSGSPAPILSQLRWRYAGTPSVRIAADEASGQLFVLAPAAVHSELQKHGDLALISGRAAEPSAAEAVSSQAPTAPIPTGPASNQKETRPAPIQPQQVALNHSGADRVARKLGELVGNQLRLVPATEASADLAGSYLWLTASGDRIKIQFDSVRETATIVAPPEQTQQVIRLLRVLDGNPTDNRPQPGTAIRVMRVRRNVPVLLNIPPPEPERDTPPDPDSDPGPASGNAAGTASATRGVQFADHRTPHAAPGNRANEVQPAAFQDPSAADPAVDIPPSFGPARPAELPGRSMDRDASRGIQDRLLRQLGLDVDIEVLPDLDVLILRGRDQDVDQITEIIREIERIAKENKPKIEIVRLRHTRSGALATLIQSVQVPLLQGRPGRCSVLSLETPNALLLIGWGEAIEVILGLIEKLDEPVAPSAEMKIFRLRHASALVAQQLVTQFLTNPQGLGPQVRIIADPRSNTLIVHAAPRDMGMVARMIEELDVAEAASVDQVRIFELSHALANDLATTIQQAIAAVRTGAGGKSANLEFLTIDAEGERLVKSGLLDNIQITPNTQTNTLLVTGPAHSMDLIAALIEQLDAPTSTAQIKVFRIVNGDANSLVLMLRSLLPSQVGQTSRPQLAGAEAESSLAPLRFSVERRTNSIIATGSAGDLRIIEALLLRLDENDMQRRTNTVYRLKNAPATDVAQVINEFLRSEQRLLELTPGELNPFQQIESEVIVVPEPVSNALVVSATPRFFKDIMDLIEKLDSQPPQVMIQVLIAEVALGDFDEFGVELGLQDSVLFDRSLLGELLTTTSTVTGSTPSGIVTSTNEIIQSATNMPGFLFNNTSPLGNSGSNLALARSGDLGTQGISNFAVGRVNNELGFGGLVLSASSESISVLIRALQEDRHLEVLSRPQVMTLDNQPAFIQVGQRVPRVTETQLTNFGQINTVEMEDVGLILGVTPRINTEGMVVMEIDAEKSQVGSEAEGIPIAFDRDGNVVRSPKIDITVAQTTVSAASGETIVLGGLIVKRNRDTSRRVPLLADVPLLGDLFRYDLTEEYRVELLIILTPQVILGPADKERIKQTESSRMSWCAADVHAIHGNGGLCTDPDCPICRSEVPTIYPDSNPRGMLDPAPAENGQAPYSMPRSYPPSPGPQERSLVDPNSDSKRSPYDQLLPDEPLPVPDGNPIDPNIPPQSIDPNRIEQSIPISEAIRQPVQPAGYGPSPASPPGRPNSVERWPAALEQAPASGRTPSSEVRKKKSKLPWSWLNAG